MDSLCNPYSKIHQSPTSSPAESTTLLVEEPLRNPKQPFWKRKTFFILSLGTVATVAAAVIISVEVIKRDRKGSFRYTEQELYFPTGGLNGILGGRTPANQTYDELLVFGSSYSDNGHPRAERYSGSSSPKGYWHGRWSNGPVWTEYLTSLLGPNVVHRNYAYGGAVVQRFLSPTGPPDMGEQIQTYLGQLSANVTLSSSPAAASAILSRKALVPTFTTTNDIDAVLINYLDPKNLNHNNLTVALNTIADSASIFIEELRSLIPSNGSTVSDTTSFIPSHPSSAMNATRQNSTTPIVHVQTAIPANSSNIQNRIAPDFLVLPIVPFDLTPKARHLATLANTTTDAARQITLRYNEVLLQGARSLADALGNRGTVFTYDVAAWFDAMAAEPSHYSVATIDTGCTQTNCNNPEQYMWWDNLHIVTSKQERLAQSCLQVLNGQVPQPRT